MPSQILVVGATGKQGSKVLRSLLAAGHPASSITCLTRNPNSPSAEKIKSEGANVVKGSLNDIASLRDALKGKDAAFLVTTIPEKGEPAEDEQGRNFISAASATALPYLVFASVAGASHTCGVPHFETKARIEDALKASGIRHAVLRPVAFFDNWAKEPGFGQAMALGLFDAGLKGKPVQMVACDDIGHFAARALLESALYAGRTMELAGDELTMEQARQAYARVSGKSVSKAWLPGFVLRALPYDLRMMFYWFNSDGFTVDIPSLKAEHPALLSFEDWLRKN
ncbi:hypothetical protein JCM11491_006497 [Sporobolomyces phaffii]